MINVIIIGSGGHATELIDYIPFSKAYCTNDLINVVGLIDDNPTNHQRYQLAQPYLGSIQSHTIRSDVSYVMGIASLDFRRKIAERFLYENASFVSVIHNNACVSSSAIIGNGVVVAPYVNIGPRVSVGDFNLLNARCSLGHDSSIGSFNFICPNVSFSGGTVVGDDNFFGINSATIPKVSIGNRNKISAGMVLDATVGDDEIVFYRFKERIIAKPK